ncbi:hypothetical protein A8F94_07400 [Bacillus sp. FJAT-27225]|uniref:hypothetical protein n=1 Tax=Bacillus sp. FJAT-27225 TaxID=1743144 RepID=UPI00080C2D02|nr:hypothetical protein [Bacillus sp. FJAT-27225]OCA87672.1 hypothetical protein A8F94_07400 [Bacillus sp. FJAT-27225]
MASLGAMKSELRSIIRELEDIASGLGHDFEGIGSEVAAAKVRQYADQCERALQSLNNVDPNNVHPDYVKDKAKS